MIAILYAIRNHGQPFVIIFKLRISEKKRYCAGAQKTIRTRAAVPFDLCKNWHVRLEQSSLCLFLQDRLLL